MWKVETSKYLKEKEKSLRYQGLSQALPDNSSLSADRRSFNNSISESSVSVKYIRIQNNPPIKQSFII